MELFYNRNSERWPFNRGDPFMVHQHKHLTYLTYNSGDKYIIMCTNKNHSINTLPNYPGSLKNLDFTPNGQLSYGKCIYSDLSMGLYGKCIYNFTKVCYSKWICNNFNLGPLWYIYKMYIQRFLTHVHFKKINLKHLSIKIYTLYTFEFK